jgi:hypothetical protein
MKEPGMLVTMTAFSPRPKARRRPPADYVLAVAASAPRTIDALAVPYLEEIKLIEGEPVSDPPFLLKLTISAGWVALALAAGSIITGLGRVSGVLMQVGS